MKEEFRVVNGFEDYIISNYGKVFSTKNGKFLKMCKNKNGYLQVGLWKDRKCKKVYIHRLVAENFINNPLMLETVDHLDGNKLNNRVDNLQWLSNSDNVSKFHREQKTEEWKEHNKKVMKEKYGKPVICVETGIIYASCKEADRLLGFSKESVRKVATGKHKQTHGLHFEYLLEEYRQ